MKNLTDIISESSNFEHDNPYLKNDKNTPFEKYLQLTAEFPHITLMNTKMHVDIKKCLTDVWVTDENMVFYFKGDLGILLGSFYSEYKTYNVMVQVASKQKYNYTISIRKK